MNDLTPVKDYMISVVEAHAGLRHVDLVTRVVGAFLNATTQDIAQSLSELIQSNQIIRVEYQLKDNRSLYYAFYLPEGARLV